MLFKKEDLIEYYESISPSKLQVEGENGFFPRDIKEPDLGAIHVSPPEKHTIITDWNLDHKEWYEIYPLIDDLVHQAFVAYYKGLYLSSLFTSIIGLELIIKYELARNGIITDEQLKDRYFSFGTLTSPKHVEKLKKVGLSDNTIFKLRLVNDLRAGIFHFNPERLKKAIKEIGGEEFILKNWDSEDIIFPENEEWSIIAEFVYNTLWHISKQFYGKYNIPRRIKEGLEDFQKLNKYNHDPDNGEN